MRREERISFATKAGLDLAQFVPHDLLGGPPTLGQIRAHDAMMVGGSGDYYVSKRNLPAFDELLDVLRDVIEVGYPVFASCFGFQLIVAALGGSIVHDRSAAEVGTYELMLTETGVQDELLGTLPRRFRAQLGRKDRAATLPPGVAHLASSERCPYQALRIPGKPIWATQFHPELNVVENRARFIRYMDGYALTEDIDRDRIFERFVASPHTAALIPRFLELIR